MYENCKIYGPYKRKDGRQHVVIVCPCGKKKTVSYPKFLTEKRIERFLTHTETIDHIDGDFNNNEPSNIRVVDRKTHVSDDVKRLKPQEFRCPYCSKKFSLSGNKLHDAIFNRYRGKTGPFCSRSCAGKYGKSIQNGADRLEIVEIEPEYTTNKILRSLQEETFEVEDAKTGKP